MFAALNKLFIDLFLSVAAKKKFLRCELSVIANFTYLFTSSDLGQHQFIYLFIYLNP